MRRGGTIAVLLTLAACLLAGPATAGAKTSGRPSTGDASAQRLLTDVQRLDFELGLPLEEPGALNFRGVDSISEVKLVNGDGYRIAVLALGQTVALQVGRGKSSRRLAATTYLAHGTATPTVIRASFGELGSVDLRFQRAPGPAPPAPLDCHSRRGPILRKGLFAGRLRFRGEGGYTAVRAHRVQGISVDVAALSACLRHGLRAARRTTVARPSPFAALLKLAKSGQAPPAPSAPTHPSRGPRPTILDARSTESLSRIVFLVLARGGRDVRYAAAEAASEGAIAVFRLVTVTAPRSTFSFNGELSRARVSPPRPFRGSGVFEHGAGTAKTWSGPLSVSLLGAPQLPLTGPPFEVELGQEF